MPHLTVRDLLSEESKWCQGAPREGKDERCLLLAIDECYPSAFETHEIVHKVRATGLIPKGMSVMQWSDAPERTFGDIRRVIEEAGI